MASINYAFKEIISKIVYYGPGLSGKTTNLQYVFKKVPSETRGELISLATDADRTLYFDFLPVNVGTIRGFSTKFQLYTVPGQVYYNATRKLVLRGVDGLVFVADSQLDKMQENIESLQNLKDNLDEYGYDIEQVPMVIQYNKRDLPNVADIQQLESMLNPRGLQYFEAVAVTGEGVFKTLKAISKLVLDHVKSNSAGTPKVIRPQPVEVAVAEDQQADHSPAIDEEPRQEPPEPEEPPKIVSEADTHTNVVVSDSSELESETDYDSVESGTDSVTEQAVLHDEHEAVEAVKTEDSSIEHPDILVEDADKAELLPPVHESDEEPLVMEEFDAEATQVSNMSLKNPLSLGKPQMAESKKVKDKKRRWFGLFGSRKKRRK